MGGPEVALFRPRVERPGTRNVEQSMEKPGIRDVDLHHALAHVFSPGRQHPHHERVGQQVEIPFHGGLGDAEGPRQLGAIPDLRMVVGEHHPGPVDRPRTDRDSELGEILLHERADQVAAPAQALRIGPGEVRAGVSAPQPEPLRRRRKRAGRRSRSERTRSTGSSSGRRWISSLTTRPRSGPSAIVGSARRVMARGPSGSKVVAGPCQVRAISRASVVLPI